MLHRHVDLVDGSVKSAHIQNLNAKLCRDIVGALNVDLPVRQMLHFDALSLCGACKMLHRRVDLVDGFVKSAHIQNLNAKLCRDIVGALNVDLIVRQMLHRRVDLVDGFVKSAHIQNLNAKHHRGIVGALNVDLMMRQILHFDAPSLCGSRRWYSQVCAH